MNELYYKIQMKQNNQWRDIWEADAPFFTAETLDDALDTGKFVLSATKNPTPIKPFTPIRILTAYNQIDPLAYNRPKPVLDYGRAKYMLASSDSIEWIGANLYKHSIELIELTKILERDICDTMTFTNALGRSFISGARRINMEVVSPGERYLNPIFKPYNMHNYNSTVTIPSAIEAIELRDTTIVWDSDSFIEVIAPDGNKVSYAYNSYHNIDITQRGDYKVNYHCHIIDQSGSEPVLMHYLVYYGFGSVETIPKKPYYTIPDVINRILSAGVTRRDGIEAPKYTLDTKVAERYKNLIAPEFYITRSNLFEALMQVGAFIHAIPRLLWNEETDKPDIITFDELGSEEEYELPSYAMRSGHIMGVDIDEYCGALDSIAENLINTTDVDEGSITEPDYNAFKTMRTEEGTWRISNDTAILLTEMPIYRVLRLEMGYTDGTIIGDITPYLYESSEYATLTSYGGAFPYAKQYALLYRQGDNKITQFNYKNGNPIDDSLSDTAIRNILEQLGYELMTPLKSLAFRVTYIPIVTGRIKQFKPHNDFPLDSTLLLNQSANTVENKFYGEHLKGVIARIGNVTEKMTYAFRRYEDMPKIGQLMDGKYIVALEGQYTCAAIFCTITLTPNFNKLSAYLGLNSNYRLFDVSEKQSVDRYINYSEICEIGDDVDGDTASTITLNGINAIADSFSQAAGHLPISAGLTQGHDKDGNAIQTQNMHSAISCGMGNSIAFLLQYLDNYGAGYKSVYRDNEQNTQSLVPYGDEYGEIETLGLRLCADIHTTTAANQSSWGDALPVMNEAVPAASVYFDTGANRLVIKKDSRERIAITQQLAFVANRQTIMTGAALSHNNLLVTRADNARGARAVFLPYKLNGLRNAIDLAQATTANMPEISVDATNKKIIIGSVQNTTVVTFKSWALVDPSDGTVYIGENLELAPGTGTPPIVMTFKSNKN